MGEALRFFVVALLGLGIDLGLAWLLAERAGWALWQAAAAGFSVAALANYGAHEYWTFRGREGGLSARRASHYVGMQGLLLGIRLAAVQLVQVVLGDGTATLLILLLATGCSFLANFLVSKWLIFAPVPIAEDHR